MMGSAGSSRSSSARATAAPPPVLGQAEEGPGALAVALDQAGLRQEPQMARDARLRLAQDVGEVGDGQLGLAQQRQHAQARLLARRLQRRVEGLETELAACTHGASYLKQNAFWGGPFGPLPTI